MAETSYMTSLADVLHAKNVSISKRISLLKSDFVMVTASEDRTPLPFCVKFYGNHAVIYVRSSGVSDVFSQRIF